MKAEISAVRKTLRACQVRKAHHQIASRKLAAAVKFAETNPAFSAECLAEAKFSAAHAEAVDQAARRIG